MDIDYYEDAMSMVQAAPNSPEQQEIAKEAQRKAYAKFKVKETGINKGFGENTIFINNYVNIGAPDLELSVLPC